MKVISAKYLPSCFHDDVIKWKQFPRYWPFVRGIHRSPHKGQWRGALMFSLICARINDWVNNREAGDLRRHLAHYDVTVMSYISKETKCFGLIVLLKCHILVQSLWRHQMETFAALLAICAGNSPVPGEFPAQRPVTRSFDAFFDLRLNKRLREQLWGRWFETLSHPLWRHFIGYSKCVD